MYNASNGFIDALRFGSNICAAKVTLYQNGLSTGVVLPISDAQFTVDRNSEFRRSGELTLEVLPTVPPETITIGNTTSTLLPLNPTSPLAPFGNEISVEMSVVQNGQAGQNGWVPLGIYQIATTTVDDSGTDLQMTLQLYDRSWAIAQRQLLTSYTVPAAGGDLQSELIALINYVWGTTPQLWTYNITTSDYRVPAGTYNQGEDPWAAALDMFTSAGYELYFDINGNIVGKPTPNPNTQPIVWNFVEDAIGSIGTPNYPINATPFSTPIDCTLTMTRDGISNDFFVAATGANNATAGATPIQAQAADTNPQSPTYINGPMGNIPTFISDSLITTSAQAQEEATYDLQVSLASAWTISIDSPPNPLFDIDDVCTISRARLDLDAQPFVVDTLQIDVNYQSVTTLSGRIVA